uniref:Sensor histidine kinase NatK-like C-terminal domain-containing protein n=1 Tax=uncultured Bacillota bacterium TaxID=344338 RepID=A0A650EPQ8_9FIRM|nr:hypothetical protein Firmicute1046_3140 [uncultured Firmicutes bacterium]
MATLFYSFILNMVDVGIIFLAISGFTVFRRKSIGIATWMISAFIAAVIVSNGTKPVSSIVSAAIILGAALCGFKNRKVCITVFVLYFILMSLMEMVSVSIVSTILQIPFEQILESFPTISNVTVIGSKVLILAVGFAVFYLNRKNYFISNMVTLFQMALTITAMILLTSLFDTYYYTVILGKKPSAVSITVSILVLVLFLILIFILFYKMQVDAKKEREFALKKQYSIMTMSALKQIEKQIEINRSLRHDMRHYLTTMYNLTVNNELESACAYYDEVEQEIKEKEEKEVIIKDAVIASILLHYKSIEEEHDFKFDVHVPAELHVEIPAKDLSAILQNVLENAKNAVSQMSEGRYIYLEIKERKNILRIICKNPYSGPKKNIHNIKPDGEHGHGLRNIKRIAQSYDGNVTIENENNIFEIKIDLLGKILK